MTAQEQYRRMVKECITPALRERGWRGGSGKYYLNGTTGHVGSVILSGNHRRSNSQVRAFHMHIGVRSMYLQEFQEGTGRAPLSKRPSHAVEHDWLDEVATFTITSEDDPLDVGAFVWTVLESQALSPVVASLDDAGLRRAVDECPVGAGYGGARTLMDIAHGNFETASRTIESWADSASGDSLDVLYLRTRLREAMTRDD